MKPATKTMWGETRAKWGSLKDPISAVEIGGTIDCPEREQQGKIHAVSKRLNYKFKIKNGMATRTK